MTSLFANKFPDGNYFSILSLRPRKRNLLVDSQLGQFRLSAAHGAVPAVGADAELDERGEVEALQMCAGHAFCRHLDSLPGDLNNTFGSRLEN